MIKKICLFSVLVTVLGEVAFAKMDGCNKGYKIDNICYSIQFKNGLKRAQESNFYLTIIDLNLKKKIQYKDIKVKLWMIMPNGEGHGTEPAQIKKTKDKYFVSKAWFFMLGQWQVILSGEYLGKKIKHIIPICMTRKSQDYFLGICENRPT